MDCLPAEARKIPDAMDLVEVIVRWESTSPLRKMIQIPSSRYSRKEAGTVVRHLG